MSDYISIIGKTIKDAVIDGFGIEIKFTDGTKLCYDASDGGYSMWEFIEANMREEENNGNQH